jgi:hypothetical protein
MNEDDLHVSDSYDVLVLLTTNPVVDTVEMLLVTTEELILERPVDVWADGLGVGWIEM